MHGLCGCNLRKFRDTDLSSLCKPELQRTIRPDPHQSAFPFGVWGTFFEQDQRKSPRPRRRRKLHILSSAASGRRQSFRCSSFQNRTRCAGLRFCRWARPCSGFAGTMWENFRRSGREANPRSQRLGRRKFRDCNASSAPTRFQRQRCAPHKFAPKRFSLWSLRDFFLAHSKRNPSGIS